MQFLCYGSVSSIVRHVEHYHTATDHEEALRLGQQATAKDTRGIFRFNSGKERKTFPDYNPYTIQRCRDCDIAKGEMSQWKHPSIRSLI